MSTTLNLSFLTTLKNIAFVTATFSSLALSTNSFATVIDFDELDPVFDEEFPCWCDNPLSNQYLDKGLLISEAWVVGADHDNSMLTSNFATLKFVGELPTFISMNVTSIYGDAVILDIYGPSGFLFSPNTSGWRGLEEYSTPEIPNEFVSFSSDTGISYITIQGFYNMRLGASIDNITFTRTPIPEPTSIALITLGLLGLMWRRYRFHGKKE